jgi:hypothetical protein
MAIPSTNAIEHALAYTRAELAYLRAADERHASVDALLMEHPDSLAGWLLKIAKHVAAKDAGAMPALAAALAAAEPLAGVATTEQRAHLAAARAWLARKPLLAAGIYSQLAASAPHNLLAVRLAQSCWYFLGHRARVRLVAERARHRWSSAAPGYDVVLAMTAFGRAETGDGRGARALADRALALEPRSPFARHALAHGLATEGRIVTAHRMLADSTPLWRVGGRMDAHNAWHQALFALQIGQRSAALAAFDRELATTHDASACADATDLLWRLDLAGVDTGFRWQPLASAWTRHLTPGFWGFLDVLAGIAFHRAGRTGEARALRRAIVESRTPEGTVANAAAARTALAATEAFTHGDYAYASLQLRQALPLLGGSVPQRELLESTLFAAEKRAGGELQVAAAA